jgi:hypothetical protein
MRSWVTSCSAWGTCTVLWYKEQCLGNNTWTPLSRQINDHAYSCFLPLAAPTNTRVRARTHTKPKVSTEGIWKNCECLAWHRAVVRRCLQFWGTLKESSIWELKRRSSDITRQKIYVWRNIEVQSCHHCYCGRAISIKYHECVSVFCLSYPACKSLLFWGKLWSQACPTLPYFSALFHKRHDCPEEAAAGVGYWI